MINILINHGIEAKEENGNIFALDVWFDKNNLEHSNWINVTTWSENKLYNWLGY